MADSDLMACVLNMLMILDDAARADPRIQQVHVDQNILCLLGMLSETQLMVSMLWSIVSHSQIRDTYDRSIMCCVMLCDAL